ncbi:MAG: hypothetical protein ABJA98_33645 [Acidobacteriota bacterium]
MALATRQNPDLLSMIGLGTDGGQPRADGSPMERGIHLRWQLGDALGFPPGGFDLYRRAENLDLMLRCGSVSQTPVGSVAWLPKSVGDSRPLVTLTASGKTSAVKGCGANAVKFLGEQSLHLDFPEPVRYVRITLDKLTPAGADAVAGAHAGASDIEVARGTARRGQDRDWLITLFADRIDRVVLNGKDMIVCEICVAVVEDGYDVGWGPLPLNTPYPIYLPITHAGWNSPHAHAPDDQAEAEARLPPGLSADRRQNYSQGFARDLHGILGRLVGTDPQRLYRIGETDAASGAAIEWPGLHLLNLTALDPNLSRILGVYWCDGPPAADRYYDYRLVAHYGDTAPPGRYVTYATAPLGTRYSSVLEHDGLTHISPNPMDVVRASWDGSVMNALWIAAAIPGAPLVIRVPRPSPVIAIKLLATETVRADGLHQQRRVDSDVVTAGQRTILLEAADGEALDTVVLETQGDVTLFEIGTRTTREPLGDVVYVTFHHRIETPDPLAAPTLEPARVVAARTGLDADGAPIENQSRIGLRWSLPDEGDGLEPGAAVLYHVRRANRGRGEQPAKTGSLALLNGDRPTLLTRNSANGSSTDTLHTFYTDRDLPDGWYDYQVRGIDLFGRLSAWSASQTVQVLDHLPPPAPQRVQAQYLDPADPNLSATDRTWTRAHGSGLKVGWEWPGMSRLQAPDVVPPSAEFRIYATSGELNSVAGVVSGVSVNGKTSVLTTDITWRGDADAWSGESIRVGRQFFQIIGNDGGANIAIRVDNLTLPALSPAPGPCRVVFSRGRSYWTDYSKTVSWQRRVRVEPAVDIPIVAGRISMIGGYDGSGLMTRPGALRTVTTDRPLRDAEGVLTPGALICEGVVYPAYGHTVGTRLKIHIVPQTSPTDATPSVAPRLNAPFSYFPGRRYEIRIEGFGVSVDPQRGTGIAHVAASCADGRSYVSDDPAWSRPERGGLGGRPGNEGAPAPACKVFAVKRSVPLAPRSVPVAAAAIFAGPADYYGRARYTLSWEAVPDAVGYAIYRCSGAALFDHDRAQRQGRKGYYSTLDDVFADDPGFSGWLAAYDPSLTATALQNRPDAHLAAWRAWANHYYPQLTDAGVQTLADRAGNEKAFGRVNKDAADETIYLDMFDGRGRGMQLYRVRAFDAAGNPGPHSNTYPPVHIFDITAPATPVVTSARGGENQAVLTWRANRESDLKEYWIWRGSDPLRLSDVRRTPATAVVTRSLADASIDFIDANLIGLQEYFYRVAAVDANGNVSPPTSILTVRVADSTPPSPPRWERAEWITRDRSGGEFAFDDPKAQGRGYRPAVALGWLADERLAAATVERRGPYERLWRPVATVAQPVNATDPDGEDARRFLCYDETAVPTLGYTYRIRAKDLAGNINTLAFNEVTVATPAQEDTVR